MIVPLSAGDKHILLNLVRVINRILRKFATKRLPWVALVLNI